ncbi:zinc finger protein 30-like isoform X1 [Leguminivora glycinivorella]|uniref:zinc finger protein 30-like isoform X1 n=1 Tax=Leguminivora glycinivorella TaxID=1035111 RepID=UPI0020105041|nr:zinc finger protein 30-like isoform X1 [Leguminivora glycinivorella]
MEGKSTDWVRGPSGPTVCRCCFAEGCYKDISTEYFWMGKKEVYCEMLTETFDLSIAFAQTSGPNSNSRLICEPCISRLRDASEFKKQVQECEKMFMQYLDPGRSTVEEIQLEITQEPMEKGVKLEPVKLEKNQSDDDFDDRGGFEDMDEDDLDDQPLTKLASKVPKKESVDLLDLLDNAKAEKRKSSTKAKASPAKKAKTKKETPKATVSKPKPEKKKKGQQNEESNQANEDITAVENIYDSLKSRDDLLWRANLRKNFNIVTAMTTICPFAYKANEFLCIFCKDTFSDSAELRKHNRDRHANLNKYPKHYCLPVKMDFTAASCKVCAADIPNYDTLKSHLAEHGKIIDTKYGDTISPYCLGSESHACQICEKQFQTFTRLLIHMVEHTARFKCQKCDQGFYTHAQHVTHITDYECSTRKKPQPVTSIRQNSSKARNNKPVDIHSSLDTNEEFEDIPRTQSKITQNSKFRKNVSIIITTTTVYPFKQRRGVFQCFYCDTTSLDPDDFRSHNRAQHNDIKSCPIPSDLREDQRLSMDFEDASCKLCLAEIPDYPTLKSHLAEHGKILDISLSKSLIPYKLNKDEIVCQVCNKTYQSIFVLRRHMNVHFENFICDQCGKAFKTKNLINIHRLTHESGVYSCKECDKTFPLPTSLNYHTRKVHLRKVAVYRCKICKEGFSNLRHRLLHMSQVHGHKMPEYPCPHCDKVYDMFNTRNRHIKRKHLKDNRFACTLCDMKFFTNGALQTHLVTHTGEKKFQCDICKKAYGRLKTLREHMRIHNNDRRFACAVCGLTFVQKISMKQHMRVHHPTEYKQEFESCSSSTC